MTTPEQQSDNDEVTSLQLLLDYMKKGWHLYEAPDPDNKNGFSMYILTDVDDNEPDRKVSSEVIGLAEEGDLIEREPQGYQTLCWFKLTE